MDGVDSRTVAMGAAGLLVTIGLGALAGSLAGVKAGIFSAVAGLAASVVANMVMQRQARDAVRAKEKQELLEMLAPPRPLDDREDEE